MGNLSTKTDESLAERKSHLLEKQELRRKELATITAMIDEVNAELKSREAIPKTNE